MKKQLYRGFVQLLFFIFNLQRFVDCSICETCICAESGPARVVNCRGKRLEGNNIFRFDLLMFDEEPRLAALNLAENGLSVLPVDMFRNLNNLKVLNLSENYIENIPDEAFDHLQSLEELDLSKNNLTTLTNRVLERVTNIELLDLSSNRISELDPAINLLTRLIHLDLSHNNLENLPNGSLKTLTELRHLDLSFNKIVSLGEDNLSHLNNLTSLLLNNNHLVYLSPHELPVSIEHLNVGYNMISAIPNTLVNLKILEVYYNEIRELDAETFGFSEIESLNISGNKLTSYPDLKLKKLNVLDLSFNQLPTIPESISNENLPNLSLLVISGNPIRDLKFNSELRLRSFVAQSLDLLENIDEGAFAKLGSPAADECLNLTISKNEKLTFIQENAFNDLNLCSLDLSSNNLMSVSPLIINSKNNLTKNYSIDLQSNPFHCDCSLQWMLLELLPKLYTMNPELLENLRCATPPNLKNRRMVHWYKWKEEVFCEDSQILVSKSSVQTAGVMERNNGTIKIESSTGMLAALIGAAVVLSMLVAIGIVLARRIAVRRSRRNRRF
ncbi:leucine-rich repeat protein soc-2 homolog [Athalia rosae]|uniref:leucine-rich repeat protein soc-2 homolog n=1 Tax=Athalia rosae TaxID=37344 RepID=UPI0020349F75|nr:leucine-rich repeat protein soc-2 homolog [Athalia rosae]